MLLIDIAKGWFHYLRATPSSRIRMEQRLKVCDDCSNKEQLSPVGGALMEVVNSPANTFRCGLCKCPLGALASLPDPACKAGKWIK